MYFLQKQWAAKSPKYAEDILKLVIFQNDTFQVGEYLLKAIIKTLNQHL